MRDFKPIAHKASIGFNILALGLFIAVSVITPRHSDSQAKACAALSAPLSGHVAVIVPVKASALRPAVKYPRPAHKPPVPGKALSMAELVERSTKK